MTEQCHALRRRLAAELPLARRELQIDADIPLEPLDKDWLRN